MSCGVSDPCVWEAIQGGLKGRKNDYVAEGCGLGGGCLKGCRRVQGDEKFRACSVSQPPRLVCYWSGVPVNRASISFRVVQTTLRTKLVALLMIGRMLNAVPFLTVPIEHKVRWTCSLVPLNGFKSNLILFCCQNAINIWRPSRYIHRSFWFN
jgi:hypothetical protein